MKYVTAEQKPTHYNTATMEFEREEPQKRYIAPEEFPDLITYDQLKTIMDHQRQVFEAGRFTDRPLPETDDEQMQRAYEAFAENREIYDDEIDDAIEADDIIDAIRPNNLKAVTPETARSIRIRSSVIAAQKILIKRYVKIVPREISQPNHRSDHRVA